MTSDQQQYLVSVSKDTLLKVWDLETQCCVQTVVGHRCEIWSLAVLHKAPSANTNLSNTNSGVIVLTGAADELIRGYRLITTTTTTASATTTASDDTMTILEYYGSVERQNSGASVDKCAGLTFAPGGGLLAAQGSGKSVEVR